MKAAYLGYKAGHRDAVALSGALCTSPGSPYWETLFANDAAKFTDAFNFHTYAPIAVCKGRIAEVRRFMEKTGMGDRAIWLTEVGTEVEGAATGRSAMPQFKAHTPEQELVVAEACPKALLSLQMEGVARAYWFIFGAYGERNGAKDWGMLRRDGTVKPVFASMATMVRELGDTRLWGELDAGKSARAYLYEQPDGSQTVVFWAVMRPAEDINPASADSLPAAAQTRPEAASPYGVCAHITAGERDERSRTFAAVRAVGARMVRCDFWWSDIERPDGSFDFSLTDAVVADAKAAGITILPILGNGHPRHGAPFENEAPWRRYVHAVAERYAGGFAIPVSDAPIYFVGAELASP